MQRHRRVFSAEYCFNAKAFFNLYHKFYMSGDIIQSLKLINPKHFVAVGACKIDLPTEHDPKHYIGVNVNSQNLLHKNLGTTILKLSDHFNISSTLLMKNSLTMKQGESPHYNLMFQKHWFDNLFAIKVSNEF